MPPTDDDSPPSLSRGQFSLLGLLSFMLAWSLFFSALAAALAMVRHDKPLAPWSGMLTFCVAWVVLALLYWSWRLRNVLLLHCILPAVATLLVWLPSLGVVGEMLNGHVVRFWPTARLDSMAMSGACFLSLLASLPVATLQLLYMVLGRKDVLDAPRL